jgi:precorrin-6B methylase 2
MTTALLLSLALLGCQADRPEAAEAPGPQPETRDHAPAKEPGLDLTTEETELLLEHSSALRPKEADDDAPTRLLEACAKAPSPDAHAEGTDLRRRLDIMAALCAAAEGKPWTGGDEARIIASFLIPEPSQLGRLGPYLDAQARMLREGRADTPPRPEQDEEEVSYALARLSFDYDQPRMQPSILERMSSVAGVEIEQGAKVADVACGLGSLAIELARALGDSGTIYAVDIEPSVFQFLQHLGESTPEGEHITPVQSVTEDIGLPPESIDLAIIFHDGFIEGKVEEDVMCDGWRSSFLASIQEALVPGGRLVVMSRVQKHRVIWTCGARLGFTQESSTEAPSSGPGPSSGGRETWMVLRKPETGR